MQEKFDRRVVVYDIETLLNCFTYTDINIDTNEVTQFVIHESRNDIDYFLMYMGGLRGMIGFNNISFDYPVIHAILKAKAWTAEDIYAKAQEIISTPDDRRFDVQIPEWEYLIPQLDLYKINHFDNNAKRTSLKDLEFWMNYPKVQDMPIKHNEFITSEQIPMILDYNLNDVEATKKFYNLNKEKVELRKQLSKQYGLRLINANDPKIGSDIFLDLLSKDMEIDKKELRKMRSIRPSIALKDIILPYVGFTIKEFQDLLNKFKNTVVTGTKNNFEESVIYQETKYDFGLGGCHSCARSGVYVSDDNCVIHDIDVSSFYPNLSINNNFRPEHLGESFNKIYKDIYEQRKKTPKSDPRNAAYKLMLNGTFGKAGDTYSYLYDPKFLLSITVNGQLLIMMLTESILKGIECEVLQVNTDGITIRYLRENAEYVNNRCKRWESYTGLELEHKEYEKMVIMDVNNYTAIDTKDVIKTKGLFEIDKEPYKDTSFKIVPIALQKYFIDGIPIKETIMNHRNIYDFCGRAKFKSDSYGQTHSVAYNKDGDAYELIEKQQKTTRYYISTNGATFMKVFPEKKKSNFINKGNLVTIFNNYKEEENYNINYNFYIMECEKILREIESKQLKLV